MRRVVYQTLLGAPFRVVGAASGIAGFVGSVWPEKVKAVLNSGPFPIQTVSAVLLVGAVLYFALLWWLKPGERDEGNGTTQITHGPQSPNFGTVHGNVTIGATPAPTQERKTNHYGIDPRRGAPLPHQEYPLAGRRQEYPLSQHQGPKPDMELREVCDRLYDSLGGPREPIDDFEARVDRKIRDGVRHWRLLTWGRKNNPNAGLDFVWGDAWLKGNFKHTKGWVRFKHPDNPRYIHEWADLHFNRAEVDAWLPPKDGRSEIGGY